MKLSDIDAIAMHDWWFSLVASLFGRYHLLIRQQLNIDSMATMLLGQRKLIHFRLFCKGLEERITFVKCFTFHLRRLRNYSKYMTENLIRNRNSVFRLWRISKKKNKIIRIYTVIRYGMLKQGIVQVIGEILFI